MHFLVRLKRSHSPLVCFYLLFVCFVVAGWPCMCGYLRGGGHRLHFSLYGFWSIPVYGFRTVILCQGVVIGVHPSPRWSFIIVPVVSGLSAY